MYGKDELLSVRKSLITTQTKYRVPPSTWHSITQLGLGIFKPTRRGTRAGKNTTKCRGIKYNNHIPTWTTNRSWEEYTVPPNKSVNLKNLTRIRCEPKYHKVNASIPSEKFSQTILRFCKYNRTNFSQSLTMFCLLRLRYNCASTSFWGKTSGVHVPTSIADAAFVGVCALTFSAILTNNVKKLQDFMSCQPG